MALFPWDDWFYHISDKERALQELYQRYTDDKASILVHGQSYEKSFRDLQSLMIYNYSLLVLAHQSDMKEVDFKDWLDNIEKLPPPKKYDATIFEVIEGASELIGMISFGKVVFNVGKPLIKSAFNGIKEWATSSEEGEAIAEDSGIELDEMLTEPLLDAGSEESVNLAGDMGLELGAETAAESITDSAAEAGAEAGTEAAIAAADTAVAGASLCSIAAVAAAPALIFVAVGVDAIMGAIQGSKELATINAQKGKIQKALNVVDSYLGRLSSTQQTINSRIVKQMLLFRINLAILEKKVMPLGMEFSAPAKLENFASYHSAMSHAATRYGYLGTIRSRWITFKERKEKHGGTASWDTFADEISDFAPPSLSDHEIKGMLSYAQGKIAQQVAHV